MSDFPHGVETRGDVVNLLGAIDGRNELETGEWDIDDFISIPNADPVINACRRRVSNELIPLLSSRDENIRQQISPIVSDLIRELEADA